MQVNNPQWPLDYHHEYSRRVKIVSDISKLPMARLGWKKIYGNDPIRFINDWCYTYDPRVRPPKSKTMPFRLFPRQEDFVLFLQACLNDRESGLVEKARDMGATWLCCAFSIWAWLVIDGCAIGWGSRKEELVDRLGDPSSIFEKMRMILHKLPEWMLPVGFDFKKHATYMKIINPATGAAISGESGDNIGRGGRSTMYFKDESAHYERPEKIEAALGDNTDVQIDISSVNGSANVFFRRRMAGELWEPDKEIEKGRTRVFVMDWRHHPGKTQEWYDQRRKKYEDEGLMHLFAQEVDRDYSSALDKIIIPPQWVRAAVDAHKKLKFEASGAKIGALDVADEGGDKNALGYRHGVVLKYGDHWGEGDTGETSRISINICKAAGVTEFYYDAIGVGAGVKAETNRLREEGGIPKTLKIYPWRASDKVIDPEEHIIIGDENTPKNEDFFENLKAQAWWNLRLRFKKTYEMVVHNIQHPVDELISLPAELPNLQQIMMELSQAQRKESKSGKLMVDKKPDGSRSPNLAEMIAMCYCPNKEITIFDAL